MGSSAPVARDAETAQRGRWPGRARLRPVRFAGRGDPSSHGPHRPPVTTEHVAKTHKPSDALRKQVPPAPTGHDMRPLAFHRLTPDRRHQGRLRRRTRWASPTLDTDTPALTAARARGTGANSSQLFHHRCRPTEESSCASTGHPARTNSSSGPATNSPSFTPHRVDAAASQTSHGCVEAARRQAVSRPSDVGQR
jgi:hypothetical protein